MNQDYDIPSRNSGSLIGGFVLQTLLNPLAKVVNGRAHRSTVSASHAVADPVLRFQLSNNLRYVKK